MSNWRKMSFLSVLLVTVVSSGCSSMSPFSWFGSSDQPATGRSTLPPGRGIGQPAPKPDPSFTSKIGSSFRSVGNKVSSALTIKEKVVKAKDPVALDNRPSEVSPDLYVMTAGIYEKRGQLERAQDQYTKALKITPNHRKALIGLARLHDRSGAYAMAETTYRKAAHLHPQDPVIHNDFGLCLARQKKTQQAISHLQKAIELDPTKPNYRMNLAVLFIDGQQVEAAYQQLASVHDPSVARYNTGYLLHQQGQRDLAIEQFQLAVRANPELDQARQMLAKLGAEAQHSDSHVEMADNTAAARPRTPATSVSHVNVLRLPKVESKEGDVELDSLPPTE